MIATLLLPGLSSSSKKVRPIDGVAPRRRNKLADTEAPVSRSGSPRPVRLNDLPRKAEISAQALFWSRQSRKFAGATANWLQPLEKLFSDNITILSGSWKGSGRRTTALITVKMAELAPMPRASVITAMAVKPGRSVITRIAYLTSFQRDSMQTLPESGGHPSVCDP